MRVFPVTMSFGGYFCCPFPSKTLCLHFFSDHVSGLVWFGSIYLVTPAEFVADKFGGAKNLLVVVQNVSGDGTNM